jgi:hypothetical protein
VNAHVNKKGEINAEDVTLLAGAVVKEHGEKNPVNLTLAGITNAEFNTFTGYGRLSKDIQATNNLTVTPFVAVNHDFTSEKTGADAGARLSYDLGKGNSLFVTPSVNVADVAGTPRVTGTATGGYAWGGAEKAAPTEFENRMSAISSGNGLPVVAERTLEEKIAYFKTHTPEQQAVIVEHIANDYLKNHKNLDIEQARTIVWQEIKAPEKQDQIDLTYQL